MTKETYFEMCEQLGTEPVEDEIPVDFEDFPSLVQTCFVIYNYLTDNWDTMGGSFMGKDYSIVFNLLNLYKVDKAEQLMALEFMQQMDSVRQKIVSDKIKQKTSQK